MRGRMTACFQRKDFHLMPLSRARFTRIVAGTAVVVAATPTIAPAQAPLVIKAAITPVYYDAIPVLYAQHTGMFAKAGLDLDLGRLPTGAAITAAVAGGSLDVAKATFFPQVVAFSRGIPLTVIAPAVVYDSRSPNGALVTAKNSPIKSAADMAGKIIGVNSLADPTRPAMAQWLEQGGVSKDAVKYVEIPMSLEPAAVDAHRIDAMMLTAPIIDETLATGKYRIIAPVMNTIAPRWLFSAFFARQEWAAKNKEAGKRVAEVIVSAASYTNQHHADLTAVIADLVGATPESIARMTYPTAGTTLSVAEMQPMIDIAARYGLIEKRYDARAMIFDPNKV
jgi:NitT/TauT family transport system substrate-binding protein